MRMWEGLRARRGTLIATTIVLLPLLAGAVLWHRLPEQMPIHFGLDGQADGYAGKAFGVLALPLILAAAQVAVVVAALADPRVRGARSGLVNLIFWICPLLSLLCGGLIYAVALGAAVNMSLAIEIFLGLLFVALGVLFPSCGQNYTIGIRLPWTLADPGNWAYTHRLAGKVWIAGGLATLAGALLGASWVMLPALVGMVAVPTAASCLYARRH